MLLKMRNFVQNLVSLIDHVSRHMLTTQVYSIQSVEVMFKDLNYLVYIDRLILLSWLTEFFS